MVRSSTSVPETDETRRPWNRFDPDQFYGFLAVLVGLSQLPLALSFAPRQSLRTFVVGSGGVLLVSIGINLFSGRAPFESGWSDDGVPGRTSAAVLTLVTLAVVVASVLSALP